MGRGGTRRQLDALARLYGVQTTYRDVERVRHRASTGPLLAVLRTLGAPVSAMADVPEALRARAADLASRPVDHVTVAWDGATTHVPVGEGRVRAALVLEDGTTQPLAPAGDAGGVTLPPLPPGYHRLTVRVGSREALSMVISAPRRCPPAAGSMWGVFLPLYALRRRGDWGVGSFADLEALMDWAGHLGGATVGTLPLLPAFLGASPFEFSPYAPVSRLFWNELFVEVERVPEFAASPEVRSLVESSGFRAAVRRARSGRFVDYRAVAAVNRRALEALVRGLDAAGGDRRAAFERDLRRRRDLRDYARFRAHTERTGSAWHVWSAGRRDGRLSARDVDPAVERYHAYAQWVAAEQVGDLARRTRRPGEGLYLDLPLGVHPDGYDAWRHRDAFASGANGGAPPDPFFPGGQEWGFRPLHPERIRETGYAYPIACLRHFVRHAGMLRIDHVMGLHRLFWVPHGMPAAEGVYVRYRPEEWYAILALEASRTGTLVLGEDLGTVPKPVRHAMKRHGVLRSHVVQFEVLIGDRIGLSEAPAGSVASLNTHDMPPFAAFWTGLEGDRRAGGLTDAARRALARRARARRELLALLRREGRLPERDETPDAEVVARALLAHLAAGPAALVVANLEDLWGETQRQNLPGTHLEVPNWRLRAARTFEQFRTDPAVVGTLKEMDRLRKRPP